MRLGADAVAIAIGVRGESEGHFLKLLSDTVMEAEPYGLPVIAHIYPRMYEEGAAYIASDPENIAWAVRCGIECGADVVKVIYPGDPLAFGQIISSCPVPVVAAGAARTDTFEQALLQAEEVISSGAAGVTVGRNVWAPGRDVGAAIGAYKLLIHEGMTAQKAIQMAGYVDN